MFLIVPCNKNLGPAIIERHDYLKIAMRDHLSDTTTYKFLSTSEIDCYSSEINKYILDWLKTYHKNLAKMECAFIREELKSNLSPFAHFYLTLKAHKLKPGQTVDQLKSRPIVSAACSMVSVSGWTASSKKLPNEQYLTLKIRWNSKNNSLSYTSQQTLHYSLPTPCPCIPTSQHTRH